LAHELERRFPSAVLVYRTEELMALAALGQVDSVRARLAKWEATPEPADRGYAGSRAYIAGLELMAHGNVSEGRAVLARTLPLYRRLREAGEFHSELVEILTVAGELKEAWATALTDLQSMKTPDDSMGMFLALGAIAARQGRLDDALRYDRLLVAAGKRAAARYDRLRVGAEKRATLVGDIAYERALLAGYRGDRESAVRFLEEAQNHGQAEHRFIHREPGLIGMLDYPPFQEFLKPRN